MTNPNFIAAGLFLVSGILAGAWTWRVESQARTQKTIKFAYLGSPEDARHQSARRFRALVEAESQDAIHVELFCGGQLGGDRDAIEGVRLGTIEMTVAGAGIFANFEPKMGVTALPFLFDSFEEAWAFNDSDLNARITRRLRSKGIRVLGHWDNGFRCITNSVHAVHHPDDLHGLMIRTPENPIILATMKALGARPSPLPWTELYMALQQGAFDGQENPIPIIYANKLYEVQKHLSITNHIYEPMPVVISEVFWQSLNDEERRLIAWAVERSQEFNRNLIKTMTDELVIELQAQGMTVTHPDRGAFRQAASKVALQFADSIGADLIRVARQFPSGASDDASDIRGP